MIRIYMKKYIVWILLTMAGLLLAEPIARVGNYDIDSALLYERMNSYKNENSLEDAHKRAMQELIEEQLLIIYAQEQNIEISTEEVNAFSLMSLLLIPGLAPMANLTNGNLKLPAMRRKSKNPQ